MLLLVVGFVDTEFLYIAQTSHKLMILLPQQPCAGTTYVCSHALLGSPTLMYLKHCEYTGGNADSWAPTSGGLVLKAQGGTQVSVLPKVK